MNVNQILNIFSKVPWAFGAEQSDRARAQAKLLPPDSVNWDTAAVTENPERFDEAARDQMDADGTMLYSTS